MAVDLVVELAAGGADDAALQPDPAILEVVVAAPAGRDLGEIDAHREHALAARHLRQDDAVRPGHHAAPGEALVAPGAHAIGHRHEQLVLLRARHDRAPVHLAVGIHVAVAQRYQAAAQGRQHACRLGKLDVVANQRAEHVRPPVHGAKAVACGEDALFRAPSGSVMRAMRAMLAG